MRKNIYLTVIFCFTFVVNTLAQDAESPYSALGLGEITPVGSVRNMAMGGTGISMGKYNSANFKNPALLTYNKLTYFEFSAFVNQRNLEDDLQNYSLYGGAINYVHFAFPIKKFWSTGLTLRPYASKNFEIISLDSISRPSPNGGEDIVFDIYRKVQEGKGSLTDLVWSNGFNIAKGLGIGLDIAYRFGPLETSSSSQFDNTSGDYRSTKSTRLNYKGVFFKPGMVYSLHLGDKDRGSNINFGATYTPKSTAKVSAFETLKQETADGITLDTDTLVFNDDLNADFPSAYSVGLSYEQVGKFSIGIDYERTNWSEFKDYDGSQSMMDGYILSTGLEYTPDYLSANNYFKRITWRGGFRYEMKPQQVEGEQLRHLGGTAGVELPFGVSSLIMAFEYGNVQLESLKAHKEQYYKLHFALTINDRWFVKRKVN